jgi:hypothetical protein
MSRERRIELLLLARDALLAGAVVPPAAARFLGEALRSWLVDGGDLEAHLRVRAPAGSHHTAAFLARRFSMHLRDAPREEGEASESLVSTPKA